MPAALSAPPLPCALRHCAVVDSQEGRKRPAAARRLAGRPRLETKLALIAVLNRFQSIRSANRTSGCFRLICSRSGWRKKSPSGIGVFGPSKPRQNLQESRVNMPAPCNSHNTVSVPKPCRISLGGLFSADSVMALLGAILVPATPYEPRFVTAPRSLME